MIVETAADATEIVRNFVEKMSPGLGFVPRSAELVHSGMAKFWRVEASVGFEIMVFEVEQASGKIMKYGVEEVSKRTRRG